MMDTGNNKNVDDDDNVSTTSSLDELSASLAQIESNLDPDIGGANATAGGGGGGGVSTMSSTMMMGGRGGRSRWSSLGTALQDVRGRLSRRSQRHMQSGTAPSSAAPDAAATTSTTAVPSTDNNGRVDQLYERLSIAELAHSTRTPLGVMQSEWQRRQQEETQQHPPTQRQASIMGRQISQTLSRPGSPALKRGRSQMLASRSHCLLADDNHHNHHSSEDEDGDEKKMEVDGGGDISSSSRRTQKSVTPPPIRKRNKIIDEEGEEEEGDDDDDEEVSRGLHRRLSTIRVLSTHEEVDEGTVTSIDTGMGSTDAVVVVETAKSSESDDQDDDDETEKKNRPDLDEDGEERMDIEVILDESIPETNILLTEDASQKLDSSHRSVLFRSSSSTVCSDSMLSSMQLDDPTMAAAGNNDPTAAEQRHLPQVYSWGTITIPTTSKESTTSMATMTSTSTHATTLPNSLYDTDETGDPQDLEPIGPSSRIGRTHVVTASTNCNHTAVVTTAGGLLTCGNNAYGAVDPTKWQPKGSMAAIPKPAVLECISVPVLQVSCGMRHTAVVTTTGTVLTWGSDDMGQLGHRQSKMAYSNRALDSNVNKPQMPRVMALGQRRAASVACGNDCTMVLTTRMQVVIAGELTAMTEAADSSTTTTTSSPTKFIPELFGLPITKIAVGAHHAIVVTCHGTAFAWGDNRYGQCGREYPQELHVPVPMKIVSGTNKTLVRGVGPPLPSSPELVILGVTCGQQHSVLVARSGELWCCGDNSHGQLGFANAEETTATPMDVDTEENDNRRSYSSSSSTTTNCYSLKSVDHLDDGVQFVAAVAGQYHTLVLDTDQNVWQFGNTEGSCGIQMKCVLRDRSVIGIVAGGNHSIAITEMPTESIPPALPAPTPVVNTTPTSSIAMQPKKVSQLLMPPDEAQASTAIAPVSNNSNPGGWMQHTVDDLVVAVSRSPSPTSPAGTTAASLLSETAVKELASRAEELLQSPSVLNGLFLDPLELERLYSKVLGATPDPAYRQLIASAMEQGMFQGLQSTIGGPSSKPSGLGGGGDDASMTTARLKFPESVRFLLLYLQNPLFSYRRKGDTGEIVFDRRGDLTLLLCEAFLGLSYEGYRAMISWVTTMYSSREAFVRCLVQPLLTQLERGLDPNAGSLQRVVPQVVAVLQWLYVTSERAGGIAKAEDFWSPAVGRIDPDRAFKDLRQWKRSSKKQRTTHFFLCSHAFLYSPTTKRNLLGIENEMEMLTMAAEHGGVAFNVAEQTIELKDPFYVLEIDRAAMLEQTFQKLKDSKATNLRKKLKVVFKGEDGIDAGGVTREFFQLMSEQLFDVNSGMWTDKYDGGGGETDIITWFNSDCFWNDEGFYLVGILVGLAVYNSVLLDVHFPPAVYRKLLGLPLGLEDMVDARLRQSLQQLLDYPGDDVEDIFCLTFSLSWMDLGTERIIELKPGGEDLPVTSENKEEYVRLYVKWLLEESIHPQYDAFERGFMRVMENSTMDFMNPHELELLVVGSPELDFDALEANTTYEGFDDSDPPESAPVVRHLWSWLKNCDSEETRLQFLRFATGSCKAPIGGFGKLPFKIQKNGVNKQQLPSSHTCFNTLLLPDYGDDYDLVAERMGRAVLECEGFGLE